MAHHTHMTEHSGAKNGGSAFWGTRLEAKTASNVGRRRQDDAFINEGLAEVAEVTLETRREARIQSVIDGAVITSNDVPEGAMYVVSEVEQWESERVQIRTLSRVNAVAAFNACVTDEQSYGDFVTVTVYRANDHGDLGRFVVIRREPIGPAIREARDAS